MLRPALGRGFFVSLWFVCLSCGGLYTSCVGVGSSRCDTQATINTDMDMGSFSPATFVFFALACFCLPLPWEPLRPPFRPRSHTQRNEAEK